MGPDELAADIFNHDKHTKALVSWIQRRYSTKEKSYRIAMLAEMLAEGSTVADYIWNLYDRPDWPYHATAYATSQTAALRAELKGVRQLNEEYNEKLVAEQLRRIKLESTVLRAQRCPMCGEIDPSKNEVNCPAKWHRE